MLDDETLRVQLCEIGRRAWQRGFCNGNEGNFSARTTRGTLLITPTGVSKGFMTPQEMVEVDEAGRVLAGEGRPSSEIALHLALYRARADVGAIIHLHTPYATAYACSSVALPQRLHPEGQAVLGRVVRVPYVQPGQQDLGQAVAGAIDAQTRCVLLGNHGVACFHRDLMATWFLLEMLEGYCRLAFTVRQVGGAVELTEEQAATIARYDFR